MNSSIAKSLQSHPQLIPCIIGASLLFWAGERHAYGYYQILRFVTTGVASFSAYTFWEHRFKAIPWGFICIAVLFNPLAPIHLDKGTWQPIDIAVGVIFLIAGIMKSSRVLQA